MYILLELEKTAIKTYKITKKICSQGTALIHYLRTSWIKKKMKSSAKIIFSRKRLYSINSYWKLDRDLSNSRKKSDWLLQSLRIIFHSLKSSLSNSDSSVINEKNIFTQCEANLLLTLFKYHGFSKNFFLSLIGKNLS